MKKFFFLNFLFLLFPVFAYAQNYDFYVDKNYSGREDGSQEKPFRTIKQAIEKASEQRAGARRIHIAIGEYEEQLDIPDSVKLFGQDRNNTAIRVPELATTNLAGNNILKDITFSGGISALTLHGTTFIENCTIKNAKKKGIDLTEGNSLVKITNSSITENGSKGLYAQKGRSIYLKGNSITNNVGEGFDIRQNIYGVIIENEITSNTESGIEILTSASDVLIKNNIIKNNRANGIANQSYPEMPDLGKINIVENTLTGNGKYGIYCGAPSGGNKTKTFFSESIFLKNNNNQANTGKPVSGSCHFERQTQNFIKGISSDIENKVTQQALQYENYYLLESEIDQRISSTQKIISDFENINFLKKIFVGFKDTELNLIKENNNQVLEIIKNADNSSGNNSIEEIKLATSNLFDSAEKEISNSNVFIDKSQGFNKIFFITRFFGSFFID